MQFGADICQDFCQATAREWLETNGLGGYASSTICCANTRRYHGLLVASLNPPVERYVLLAKLEEDLIVNGERFHLSTNQYRFKVHPEGLRYITRFELAPFPIWTFQAGGVTLEKSIFMPHGEDSLAVSYQIMSAPVGANIRLEVRPLLAFRYFHSLTQVNDQIDKSVELAGSVVRVHPYRGLPQLAFHHNAGEFVPDADWYYRFEYIEELRRGLDAYEDLFNCGYFLFDLSPPELRPGSRAFIFATLHDYELINEDGISQLEQMKRARHTTLAEMTDTRDALARKLAESADQFIVKRRDGKRSVIAGYHWFGDWGRDSFISLPGLTLATRRYDIAYQLLSSFARFFDQGMIPNRFPDEGGAPEYNNVDGTLWYFNAAFLYAQTTLDYAFIEQELYQRLAESIQWHIKGTRYNIKVDPTDGLLQSGAEGVQLTWMDARIGDTVVTQRQGKAVEVNALWHNALSVMSHFAMKLKRSADFEKYDNLALRARRSFNRLFWNPQKKCLYDVIDGDRRDDSIRPNQIFAISLPFDPLPKAKQRAVMRVVEERLLTPYGLRTLDPADPNYRGRMEGDAWARDTAYHQGTVWPWLLGHYITAYLKAFNRSSRARKVALSLIEPFRKHLAEAGLNSISEVFDGSPPHHPRGCIAQAWSVAELLRVIVGELNL